MMQLKILSPLDRKPSTHLRSRDLGLLVPEFRSKLEELAKVLLNYGISLGIGTTVRGPAEQAKMWAYSRTVEEVARRRGMLISAGAPVLASMLQDEDACFGPQLTKSLPAQSWHQWGEAADIYADVCGFAKWSGSIAEKMYVESVAIGLYHAHDFPTGYISRAWHVQLRQVVSPFHIRGFMDNWSDAEAAMRDRFDLGKL